MKAIDDLQKTMPMTDIHAKGRYSKKDIANVMIRTVFQKYKIKVPEYIMIFFISEIFKIIRDEVLSGSSFEIRGFGVFSPKLIKNEHSLHDPQTLEKIVSNPKIKVHFHPGRLSKKEV